MQVTELVTWENACSSLAQGQWDVVGDTFIKFPDFTHDTTFIYIIITTFCEQ